MTDHLWLPQLAATPAPADLAAYLRQQGWLLRSADPSWAIYSKHGPGQEELVVEVPQRALASDYGQAVSLLLEDLARIEQRSPFSVLREVRASLMDVVRLGLEGSTTRDGRIPVEAGRRVYEAARDLLLAAACSVIDPKPVFAKRKPEEAMRMLTRARFGQTELGSFVLTMECAIPPLLQPALPGNADPDVPFERKTSIRLARALHAAEGAARESGASGKIDPFRDGAKHGVSANLCDAVAELLDAAAADTLRAGFSFASQRPIEAEVPRAIAFSSDTAAIFREAAARLRDEASYPATAIVGTVVRLDSSNATAGGEAVMRVDLEGRTRHVRLSLDGGSYQAAIHAHEDRGLVRCVGDLAREGRSWVLRNPREFGSLDVED